MKVVIAAVLLWRLVVLPTGGTRTDQRDLFKPFDVPGTFSSEAACRADGAANLRSYLSGHGLPADAVGKIVCTVN